MSLRDDDPFLPLKYQNTDGLATATASMPRVNILRGLRVLGVLLVNIQCVRRIQVR